MGEIKNKIVTAESLKAVYDALNEKIMWLTPHNFLDNSDFTNPVNQRGATSYTGNKYTIDRWKSNSGYSVVTINDDCLNLKSSNGNTVYLQQFIDNKVIKSGCEYTVACTLKDGSVHTATGVASTDMTEAIRYIYVNEVSLGNIRFKYDSYYGLYLVMFSTSNTDGIDIINVALYEGNYDDNTLPEYRPKGYGVELAECQRYFINNVGANTTGFFLAEENKFRILVPTPSTMRALPEISMDRTSDIVCNVAGTSTVPHMTGVEPSSLYPNGVSVDILTDQNPGAYVSGAVYSNLKLALSADY